MGELIYLLGTEVNKEDKVKDEDEEGDVGTGNIIFVTVAMRLMNDSWPASPPRPSIGQYKHLQKISKKKIKIKLK